MDQEMNYLNGLLAILLCLTYHKLKTQHFFQFSIKFLNNNF